MMDNYSDYKDLDLAVINSNMPVHFASVDERIIAMTDPKCLPGELEIVATSRAIKKKICVLGEHNKEITSYGDDRLPKLFVRFHNIGQDVGHYDCVVMETTAEASSDIPEPPNMTRNHPPTPPQRRVDDLLQVLTVPKRKRTNRCEKATLLTSSPSRANLQAKQDKKRRSSTRREQKSNQRRTQKTQNVSEVPDYEEEEDWPCLQCFQLYRNSRPGAIWVQCQICLQWAHEDCTDGNPQFICPKCN